MRTRSATRHRPGAEFASTRARSAGPGDEPSIRPAPKGRHRNVSGRSGSKSDAAGPPFKRPGPREQEEKALGQETAPTRNIQCPRQRRSDLHRAWLRAPRPPRDDGRSARPLGADRRGRIQARRRPPGARRPERRHDRDRHRSDASTIGRAPAAVPAASHEKRRESTVFFERSTSARAIHSRPGEALPPCQGDAPDQRARRRDARGRRRGRAPRDRIRPARPAPAAPGRCAASIAAQARCRSGTPRRAARERRRADRRDRHRRPGSGAACAARSVASSSWLRERSVPAGVRRRCRSRGAVRPNRAVPTPAVPTSRPLRTTISRPTAADDGRAVQVTVAAPVRDRAGHLLGHARRRPEPGSERRVRPDRRGRHEPIHRAPASRSQRPDLRRSS